MEEFTLFWLSGHSEIVKGETPEQAMNNVGYGAGALRALDFYATGDKTKDYIWSQNKHSWETKN